MKYWAFLSYSHADEAAAARLHRELERYKLPRKLRTAHALPARLTPIFRDVEELEAASGLNTRLQDALDESRWLIVLCSPDSAKSKYVNAEIEYFLRQHGPERILCVLLAGEPPECFPPAIHTLADEPLAADLRAGRDQPLARIRLIAALAGVGFTELRNREAQRRRQLRLLTGAAAGLIGAGALAWWDFYMREHVDYYQGHVREHGIWHGIGSISADRARKRAESYRFVRHGRLNPPERVDFVNGSGRCAGDGMETVVGEKLVFQAVAQAKRYCSAAFDYTRDGSLARESLLNGLGKPKVTLSYSVAGLAQFTQEGFALAAEGSGINYVQFVRDDRGRDLEARFLLARGVPRANHRHEYGMTWTRDEAGRVLLQESLDDRGSRTGERVRYTYDDAGELREMRLEDAQGRLRSGDGGYALVRHTRDAHGNLAGDQYLSVDGQPVVFLESRMFSSVLYASRSLRHDEKGNLTEVCYFDDTGKPLPELDFGGECLHYRYNQAGDLVWSGGVKRDGLPDPDNTGLAAFSYEYNAQHQLIGSHNYDIHGRPIEVEGAASQRFRHDARGNLVSEYLYGADGKPAKSSYGFEIRHEVDQRDTYMDYSFFDAEGKPYARPDSGIASVRFTRDERGNLTEIVSLGADLKPVLNKRHGAAYRVQSFDAQGNITELRSFDTQRRPAKDRWGVAVYRRSYNRLGQRVEEACFDEALQPTRHSEGYFGTRVEYDHRGREVRRFYLDAKGAALDVPRLGGAGLLTEHDTLGRVIAETYLDAQGQPRQSGPVRKVIYTRDRYGRERERRYLAHDGQPAPAPASGCQIETRDYDALGRIVREQCLNAERKPQNRRGEGWATKDMGWDHGQQRPAQHRNAAGVIVTPPG